MGEDRELRCVPVLGLSPLDPAPVVVHTDGLNRSVSMAGHSYSSPMKSVVLLTGLALKCPLEKVFKFLFVMGMFCVWTACA